MERLPRSAYAGLSLIVIAADLLTKWWVIQRFSIHETKTVIPGFFQLVHVRNSGAAFGIGANSQSDIVPVLLNAGALAVFLVVVVYSLRTSLEERLLQTGLHLILAGAIGNLIDRFRFGSVVDFLDFFITIGGREHHWPAFNIADSAICIGVALLFFDMWRRPENKPAPASL